MDRKNINLLTSIAVVTLLLLVVGASYAYFNVTDNTSISGTTLTATSPALTSISLSQGESTLSIYLSALQMAEEKGGTTYWTQAGNDKEATVERKDVEIATAQITNGEEGKYYKCDANFTITPNDPDNAIVGLGKDNVKLHLGVLDLSKTIVIEDGNVKKVSSPVYFKGTVDSIPISANLEVINSKENQSEAINKSFTIKIDIALSNCSFVESPQFISETIKGKYINDTTLLGSKEDNNDGYLIYHDGKGEYDNAQYEAEDYSYRFSGNNPDNYVCLDEANKEGTCDSKKLYRVIGIFPTDESHTKYQTKLIKSEYLTYEETEEALKVNTTVVRQEPSGWTPRVDNRDNVNGFYWSGSSDIGWNNWKSSKLNDGLNKEDGKYLQSLKKYIDAKLINDTTWYIGGNSYSKIIQQSNMKLAYDNELGTGKLTPETGKEKCTDSSLTFVDCTEDLLYQTSKVGLMYATEYGYASEPASWTSQLLDYNDTGNENKENNWLYNGVYERLLTRDASYEHTAFRVVSAGNVGSNGVAAETAYGVRPTFILSSFSELLNGEGSKEKPWRIKVN